MNEKNELGTLQMYIGEFISCVDYLLNNQKIDGIFEKENSLYVKKTIIENMLNKNMFDTISGKFNTWKVLRWIQTDDGRYTKRLYINKKREAMICINLEIHRMLKSLKNM